MTDSRRSFYARPGSRIGDIVTLLHLPYTAWHLSYVVIGASLAPRIDAIRLVGTLVAFALGLGVGAHALDELKDRPLSTGLSDSTLRALGWGGLFGGAVMAVAAAFVISPVALAWGGLGVVAAASYSLEWTPWLHTIGGFALAWGAFPTLVGYWSQTESMSVAGVLAAGAASVFSMAQRSLSSHARHVRRDVEQVSARLGDVSWQRPELLLTWEWPLRLLAVAHVLLAIALLATHA